MPHYGKERVQSPTFHGGIDVIIDRNQPRLLILTGFRKKEGSVSALAPPVSAASSKFARVSVPAPIIFSFVNMNELLADSTRRSVPAPPFSESFPIPSLMVSLNAER